MNRIQLPLMVVVTVVVLILTFLGYFVDVNVLLVVQPVLIRWAVLIAGVAIIIGFLNVIGVHVFKLTSRAPGWFYSLVLIISAVSVLAIGLGELAFNSDAGLSGPLIMPVFINVIAPLYASTAALLPFILTFAAFRMLRLGRQRGAFLFMFSAAIVVLSQLPLSSISPELEWLRDIWLAWLAVPGLRAVLIGVALGISVMALRVMAGIERPYH
jgi:hypothetical protein